MVKVVVLEGVRGGSGGNVVYVNKNRLINMYVKIKGDLEADISEEQLLERNKKW